MKAYGDMDSRIHIFAATARGRVANPTLGLFTYGKPRYSFYRRLSGSQDQSGHEDMTKPGLVVAKRLATALSCEIPLKLIDVLIIIY